MQPSGRPAPAARRGVDPIAPTIARTSADPPPTEFDGERGGGERACGHRRRRAMRVERESGARTERRQYGRRVGVPLSEGLKRRRERGRAASKAKQPTTATATAATTATTHVELGVNTLDVHAFADREALRLPHERGGGGGAAIGGGGLRRRHRLGGELWVAASAARRAHRRSRGREQLGLRRPESIYLAVTSLVTVMRRSLHEPLGLGRRRGLISRGAGARDGRRQWGVIRLVDENREI